ncbi:hypothetical protein PYW07_016174 [Mythimna separata]|uniref:Carboxylic ester hydrolase n=1 Tax=Mythimna separata TaxID=271217 RepID=A0AAD8DW32_MYTSE|nr:hypothetical protein PYW07_016174 [Mythimna separata]
MNIFYSIIFFVVIQNVAGDGTQIKVEQGWLEGELLDLVTGDGQYYSFKGIPYALPPNGTRRFKAPQPPVSWTGVRSAKQHGSVCPQLDILTSTFHPGSEDCLFLNVYSPNTTPEKLFPVIFFIHGGSYKFGSGDVDTYGADFLVRKDVVLVTINYRLDALGFLNLGTEEVPGNAGLKDQVAAMKWVQRNIKYFGGDENQVTIMGQSAGEKYGISGAAHMDDLFYLFDPKILNLTLDKDSTEFQHIDKITTLFTDFVKYGNPTHAYESESGIKWPLFEKETKQLLNIGNDDLTVSSLIAAYLQHPDIKDPNTDKASPRIERGPNCPIPREIR